MSVERPKDTNVISCKYVFVIKRNKEGEVVRYRARLVARGFSQGQGLDCHEPLAPVAKMTNFRMFLSLTIQYDLLTN